MPIAAAIAGAAVIGAGASIVSGNKAASAATKAAQSTNDTNLQIYNQQREDYAPWRSTGVSALGKLAKLYGLEGSGSGVIGQSGIIGGPQNGYGQFLDGQHVADHGWSIPAANDNRFADFYASPDYQFRLNEGIKAIERSKSAAGKLRSIDATKSIGSWAQGQASSEYGNYVNRLASLAGIGQQATDSTSQAASNFAANTANANAAAGNARASAYANTGSAINQGVSNIASAYLYSKGYGGK